MKAAARKDRSDHDRLARWHVATCRDATGAVAALSGCCIEAWLPIVRKRMAPRRGRPARVVERAVWPGYVFVRLVPEAHAWAGAMLAGDLTGWIAAGGAGEPATVGDGEMARLIACSSADDFEEEARRIGLPKRGETWEIMAGPMCGHRGEVVRVDERAARVQMLLDLLGAQIPVTMGLDDVAICG